MKIVQSKWHNGLWDSALPSHLDGKNTVSFVFFSPELDIEEPLANLKKALPIAHRFGCSGAGEIANSELVDQSVVVTTVQFESAEVQCTSQLISSAEESHEAGASLARSIRSLSSQKLNAIYVLSDGLSVNGTELVRGIYSELGQNVVVAGGLAGDGDRFRSTRVLRDEGVASGVVAAIGIYGEGIKVVAHAGAGWLPFGPGRKITKSRGNVLFELDGKPALALYREFLGNAAVKLPSSALMFPLLLGPAKSEESRNLVRTVLSIDDEAMSMTFAGDMPQDEIVRFMRTSETALLSAATSCATDCAKSVNEEEPVLSLMVSCVGRRLVLGSSTEEEIEQIYEQLPLGSVQTGFYSYGEVAPGGVGRSDLHNQTVTLTWLQEEFRSNP